MPTGVRSLYHVAINNKGFILRGAPSQPRYIKEVAPALANQVGAGDISYATLAGSGWSYWTQTDWSGGFHKLKWADKATFKDHFGRRSFYTFRLCRHQRGKFNVAF